MKMLISDVLIYLKISHGNNPWKYNNTVKMNSKPRELVCYDIKKMRKYKYEKFRKQGQHLTNCCKSCA